MTNLRKLCPLIDGDYLIYRIGFAVKDDEPVEYALSTVKRSLHALLDRFNEAPWHRLFLSGKGNFREKIAVTEVYKGNRDPSMRPKYYQEIKDYLIHVHGAEVVDGIEADDAVATLQWQHKDRSTVIVRQDKDLNMVPGWHFNPVKEEMRYITLPEANEWFFIQMLWGDRTDNIPGIDGLGEVKSRKLLAPCNREVLKMQEVVKQQYAKAFGDDASRRYKEIANLLWMRREEGQECPY